MGKSPLASDEGITDLGRQAILYLKSEVQVRELKTEISRLRREKRHFARVAKWFALHQPGIVQVPEWCNLVWRSGEPAVDDEQLEMSEAAEAEGGRQ